MPLKRGVNETGKVTDAELVPRVLSEELWIKIPLGDFSHYFSDTVQ